jgi:hypothetical protein
MTEEQYLAAWRAEIREGAKARRETARRERAEARVEKRLPRGSC